MIFRMLKIKLITSNYILDLYIFSFFILIFLQCKLQLFKLSLTYNIKYNSSLLQSPTIIIHLGLKDDEQFY